MWSDPSEKKIRELQREDLWYYVALLCQGTEIRFLCSNPFLLEKKKKNSRPKMTATATHREEKLRKIGRKSRLVKMGKHVAKNCQKSMLEFLTKIVRKKLTVSRLYSKSNTPGSMSLVKCEIHQLGQVSRVADTGLLLLIVYHIRPPGSIPDAGRVRRKQTNETYRCVQHLLSERLRVSA